MKTQTRILIADDSPTLVDMVRHVLEGAGYTVLTAPDGLAAMNIALREIPDLVISDVEMPEMNGLQLCRILKGDPRAGQIPFLILSIQKEQYQQFWGRETGADDYLPKPFGPEQLLARVRALLSRAPRGRPLEPKEEVPDATRMEALERVNASLERRLFELTIVHGVSAIAAVISGERETARSVLERVSRLVDFSAGVLAFATGGRSYILIRKGIHPKGLQALQERLAADSGQEDGEPTMPVLLSGAEFISSRAPDEDAAMAIQPLRVSERVVGLLAVVREGTHPFEEPERELLELLAGQAALVLDNARLEEAERAHAEALERQNEELRRLNRTITDMISTVTHDLRTPLSSVLGYVDLIREEAPLVPQQCDFLDIVHRNAQRMLHMVNDLLDISRLEARRTSLNLKAVDLRLSLDDAVATIMPALDTKRQGYSASVPHDLPRLHADPERLVQVLVNLLSNASKYTPEGGTIRVTAQVEGERVRVAVKDTGIGLSELDIRHVFSKFYRAQRPELAGTTGTGLGLAIVKSIVDLHGGEVTVASKLNEGSTFSFTVPLFRGPG